MDFGGGGVVADHEDAAGEGGAAGEGVDPADAVIVFHGGAEMEGFGEIAGFEVLGADVGGGDGVELEVEAGDEAGLAEAAGGGPEELGVVVGGAGEGEAGGGDEVEGADLGREGALAVMACAVDVAGEAPPMVLREVPGTTGRAQPWGRVRSRMCLMRTPESATGEPVAGSKLWMRLREVEARWRPPGLTQASP